MELERRLRVAQVLDRRVARRRSRRRASTRWRWLKVPRSVSWPVSRSGTPCASSDANASASAWRPVDRAVRRRAPRARFSSWRRSLRWTLKSVGHAQQLPVESSAASSAGTVVSRLPARRAVELVLAGRRAAPPIDALDLLVRLRRARCVGLRRHARRPPPALTMPSLDQRVRVELAHRRVLLDQLVHQRLRVGGLVGLVVAEAAVADQVDHDAAAELLAERHRQPHGGDAGLEVVGVHVDDRHVEALGEVRRVARRARLLGLGREADLVVGDDVDRAAGRVAGERLRG